MTSSIENFRNMINSFKPNVLTEICETFLTDHDAAMKLLLNLSEDSQLFFDEADIKEYMMIMQANGEFDYVECFGIQLCENSLYKKFHPSND